MYIPTVSVLATAKNGWRRRPGLIKGNGISVIELGGTAMAQVDTQPGYFAKMADGICQRNALKTVFYAAGLALMVLTVIVVGIIVSDIIYFLFNYFAA